MTTCQRGFDSLESDVDDVAGDLDDLENEAGASNLETDVADTRDKLEALCDYLSAC